MKRITKKPDFGKAKEDREKEKKHKQMWICPTCDNYWGEVNGCRPVLHLSREFPFLKIKDRYKYKCSDCYTEWTYDK